MRFVVRAVPAADFQSWLARTRDTGSALDADTYSQLALAGSKTQAQTYSSVDPMLFEHIVQTTAQPLAAAR
jgi:heme/copper-type cytochrome/quinol oxidase subunit 2